VSVEQERAVSPQGWFQEGPGAQFARRVEPKPAAPVEAGDPADGAESETPPAPPRAERPWKTRVSIVRRGELRLPLLYELTFEDGTVERRMWSREDQSRSRWMHDDLEGRPKLVSVRLDPERACWLDANLSDNQWFDATDRLAPVRWSERVFNRWLHVLFWQAGVGG
jgi:hypothetical protein